MSYSHDNLLSALPDTMANAAKVLPKVHKLRRTLVMSGRPSAQARIADLAAADHMFIGAMTQLGVALALLEGYTDDSESDGET